MYHKFKHLRFKKIFSYYKLQWYISIFLPIYPISFKDRLQEFDFLSHFLSLLIFYSITFQKFYTLKSSIRKCLSLCSSADPGHRSFFFFLSLLIRLLKNEPQRTSLVVQWLRLPFPMQEVWVQSLVRELRSNMPQSQKPKTSNRSNIVTNSIKTLKMVHIKKKNNKTNFKKEKKEPQCLLAFIWWFCCYIYFNYLYPFFWEWTFINILGPLKCYFFHL